jgi:hypothetical protein
VVEGEYLTFDRQRTRVSSRTRLITHSLELEEPAAGVHLAFETPSLGPFRANLDVIHVLEGDHRSSACAVAVARFADLAARRSSRM